MDEFVIHFVQYGSYVAPCGWSAIGSCPVPASTASWWKEVREEDGGVVRRNEEAVTCPACVEHARRQGIYDWPDPMPNPSNVEEVEAWLTR